MGFSAMVNALFADPTLSVAATYTPPAGSPQSVKVIRRTPVQAFDAFQTGALIPAYAADVRVSEVSTPSQGATLVIGATSFTVRKYELDGEKLVWQLDLDIGSENYDLDVETTSDSNIVFADSTDVTVDQYPT